MSRGLLGGLRVAPQREMYLAQARRCSRYSLFLQMSQLSTRGENAPRAMTTSTIPFGHTLPPKARCPIRLRHIIPPSRGPLLGSPKHGNSARAEACGTLTTGSRPLSCDIPALNSGWLLLFGASCFIVLRLRVAPSIGASGNHAEATSHFSD